MKYVDPGPQWWRNTEPEPEKAMAEVHRCWIGYGWYNTDYWRLLEEEGDVRRPE